MWQIPKFGLKCTKNAATKNMFPEKDSRAKTRFNEKYVVTKFSTERLACSAIPFMQQLLNTHLLNLKFLMSLLESLGRSEHYLDLRASQVGP